MDQDKNRSVRNFFIKIAIVILTLTSNYLLASDNLVRQVFINGSIHTFNSQLDIIEAIAIKDSLEEIFKLPRNSIPVDVKIDSNSLDEAIRSTTQVDSKRLRRDVARIKENLDKRYIRSVS